MKYSTVISLLICALLALSTARAEEQSSSIKLGLFEGSNNHFIALTVDDAEVDTIAVQMLDSAEGALWTDMKFVDGWAHWVSNSPSEYVFPLSFRLTSEDEQEIVVQNIIADLTTESVDTGIQFSAPKMEAVRSSSHGSHRTTPAPTKRPSSHTTAAPHQKATTAAPKAPTTAPSQKTTTVAPKAPTSSPLVSSGKMKIMVPLYMSPGAAWTTVATAGALVPTVAIINPNSGPGNGPDSSYTTYMSKLHTANVEMIGYVHTSYGARAISDVKADIAKYASEFPLVNGIFIDEAAATADQVSYYTQVYQYIMSMPGYKYCVLNPGAVPTSGYMSISTQIVTFEDSASKFASSQNPSFATASNKDHFSVISYGATSSQMQSLVSSAKSKGYYGWVYFTDTSASGNTYGSLPSYYAAMASYMATL